MKKLGIFNPYWDTLGGGERYVGEVAKVASDMGIQTIIYWKDKSLIKALKERFELDLPLALIDLWGYKKLTSGSLIDKWRILKNLDFSFFVSDGSIPILFAKKNYLHFQVPFKRKINFFETIKLLNSKIIVNSQFTNNVIKKVTNTNHRILYPPCNQFNEGKKENIILNVGRFDQTMTVKKQAVLIEAFKKLNNKDFKLVLAGGLLNKTDEVIRMQQSAINLNVEFLFNPSMKQLSDLYAKAKCYWHAAGYMEDESVNPELMEHFGITTVEAMSAGAVPLVLSKGGQKEIVDNEVNGYWWQTVDELVEKTQDLLEDEKEYERLKKNAILKAKIFNPEKFAYECQQLLR